MGLVGFILFDLGVMIVSGLNCMTRLIFEAIPSGLPFRNTYDVTA